VKIAERRSPLFRQKAANRFLSSAGDTENSPVAGSRITIGRLVRVVSQVVPAPCIGSERIESIACAFTPEKIACAEWKTSTCVVDREREQDRREHPGKSTSS
jgi:hypothetical protein